MAGKKRLAGRYDSDLVAAYGAGVLGLPPFTRHQLYLNIPRVRQRARLDHAAGVLLAQGRRPTREEADAEAETDVEEEVEALLFRMLCDWQDAHGE